MAAARELGSKLFDSVFNQEVLSSFRISREKANNQGGTGLRVRLFLQGVPELANLPWEFLLDLTHNRFLSQSARTPVVRYVDLPESVRPLSVSLPLHILVMDSSPSDQESLDAKRDVKNIAQALSKLSEQGKVVISLKTTTKEYRQSSFL